MSAKYWQRAVYGPCPMCGKADGAVVGSTSWGHDYSCCSDECGRAFLTVGSLFAGIGGIDLGLHWAGLGPVLWQVELDPFARSILEKHWPTADRSVTDVRAAGASNLAPVDVICGGFPCTDISNAGRRAGIDGEHSGLWAEYARIVRELRPVLVFVENVEPLLVRGVDRVLGDLAALGYDAEWEVLRASDIGAPHRRARIFILAHAHDWRDRLQERHEQRRMAADAQDGGRADGGGRAAGTLADADGAVPRGFLASGDRNASRRDDASGGGAPLADAGREGLHISRSRSGGRRRASRGGSDVADARGVVAQRVQSVGERARGEASATRRDGEDANHERLAQPGLGREPARLPDRVDLPGWPAGPSEAQHAWEPPRTVAKAPQRPARLKALGNAVVPAQAEAAWRILFARVLRATETA